MSEKHPLTSKLTITTAQGETAAIENLPAPVMQALYNQITGRRERLSGSFNEDYIIRIESIRDLIVKIEQTLTQYNYYATSSNITLFHHNRDNITFTSLEKLMQYDTGRTDPVSSVSIDFDFLISVPQVGEYQNYKININLNSYVTLKDDKRVTYGLAGYHGRRPVEYTIEYVDYVVARSFKHTIDEWTDTLKKEKIFKIPESLEEHQRMISSVLALASAASIVLISERYIKIFDVTSISGAVVAVTTFLIIKEIIANFAERSIDYAGARNFFPFILMNKGDDRNHTVFHERRSRTKKFYAFVLVTCALPILINIGSYFITKGL